MSSLIQYIDGVTCRLISDLHPSDSIVPQSGYFRFIDPVRACLDRDTDHSWKSSFISCFRLLEWWRNIVSVRKVRMCIIDRTDKVLLICSWIYTPCPSDNTNITLRYGMTGCLQWVETIPDLFQRVKCVILSTLDRGFTSDIALRKSLICGTKDTLSWTSPEFRQKGDDCYTREWSDRALSEDFPYTRTLSDLSSSYQSTIPFDELSTPCSERNLIFRENTIFENMKLLLCLDVFVILESEEYLIQKSLIIRSLHTLLKTSPSKKTITDSATVQISNLQFFIRMEVHFSDSEHVQYAHSFGFSWFWLGFSKKLKNLP